MPKSKDDPNTTYRELLTADLSAIFDGGHYPYLSKQAITDIETESLQFYDARSKNITPKRASKETIEKAKLLAKKSNTTAKQEARIGKSKTIASIAMMATILIISFSALLAFGIIRL